MRMYELWRCAGEDDERSRLEDPAGPVLFWRVCDAEAYFAADADSGDATCQIVPVQVGMA